MKKQIKRRRSKTDPKLIICTYFDDGDYYAYATDSNGHNKSDEFGPFMNEREAVETMELEIAEY